MRYYTQLVFLRPGKEAAFHEFEDHVLPLLATYGGQLLLRWRHAPGVVIETAVGDPYEVHLVAFPTAEDFRNYANTARGSPSYISRTAPSNACCSSRAYGSRRSSSLARNVVLEKNGSRRRIQPVPAQMERELRTRRRQE